VRLGKDVALEIAGEDTEVDRSLLEGVQAPLTHLLRNAVDHGVESPSERIAAGKPGRATITLRAYQKPGAVVIEVEDDGRGLDADRIRRVAREKGFLSDAEADSMPDSDLLYMLCRSGFTTRSDVDDISGRGVGLDVVKVRLERMRGPLSIASEKGRNSIFRLFLPQSLSALRGLVLKAGEISAAVPNLFVEKCFGCDAVELARNEGLVEYDGVKYIPVSLEAVFGKTPTAPDKTVHMVVMSFRKRKMVLACDRVVSEQELVVKNLGAHLQQVSSVLGVSLLADGTPAPILDVIELYEHWNGLELSSALPILKRDRALDILVVDDAVTSRHVESTLLENMGHRVEQAGDGAQALRILNHKQFDLVVTDLEMPNVDGIELVRRIRRIEYLRDIPVIMVTSVASDEMVDRSFEAGINAYLTKDRLSRKVLSRSIKNLFPSN